MRPPQVGPSADDLEGAGQGEGEQDGGEEPSSIQVTTPSRSEPRAETKTPSRFSQRTTPQTRTATPPRAVRSSRAQGERARTMTLAA